MTYNASWTNTNPVTVGSIPKKTQYDATYDNNRVLMSSMAVEHNAPSGGTQGGAHKIFRKATCNQLDSPAPEIYSMEEILFEYIQTAPTFPSSSAPEYMTNYKVIDSSIDYRDKFIEINGLSILATANAAVYYLAGGSSDNKIYAVRGMYLNPNGHDAGGIDSNIERIMPSGNARYDCPSATNETFRAFDGFGYTKEGHGSGIWPSSNGDPHWTIEGQRSEHTDINNTLMIDNTNGNLIGQIEHYQELGFGGNYNGYCFVVHGRIKVWSKENHV